MALEITDSNFEETVLKVISQYWLIFGQLGMGLVNGWPYNDELMRSMRKAVVGKVDIDSNQQYAAIGQNIPTVLVFKNGELVDRKVGFFQK